MQPKQPIRSFAFVSSIAVSLVNFRGALIAELVRRGIRVYALAPDFDERMRKLVRSLGAEPIDISLDRTGMQVLRDTVDFVRLCRQLRRLAPDAVLAYFVKPVIYGSLAAWVARVPRRYSLVAGLGYIFTDTGTVIGARMRALRFATGLLYRVAFSVCDRIFFQNHDDIEYLLNGRQRIRRKVVRVHGSGVDLQHFVPVDQVTRPVTFLLMARLLREKGVQEYVGAAQQVKARYPSTRFILLGDVDPNPGSVSHSEIKVWVDEGTIEWPGQVEDVRPWIAKASVYVLPSYREGMPRSTQEAMAMARPVITTDAVGCRETVEDSVNGFIVPVRDTDALRDAMIRFVETPAIIGPMGRASRRLAEDRFDVKRINAGMLRAMDVE